MRGIALAAGLLLLAWLPGLAAAASPAPPAAPAAPESPPRTPQRLHPMPVPGQGAPAAPHGPDELDCRGCHQAKHRGVVQMWVGTGGRGAPPIPSHMFQVRVECVACHVAPKETTEASSLVGQTFRPSEEACLSCHGPKYRGMLAQWVATLGNMRAVVEPKAMAARAVLAKAAPAHPRLARARKLAADADFNVRYVAAARGVHNVFYAADLLKLANVWLDESLALLGAAPAGGDDRLVRGGYCAVLCHEPLGVKAKPTVTFGGKPLPHVRHVEELGATCTSCHSAEKHKAVTATRATCTGCHHSPRNERCESCHGAQAAFYRGQTKTALAPVAPNVMAETVSCTGCHDFGAKSWRQAMPGKCTECHEAAYLAILPEWAGGLAGELRAARTALGEAERALAAARRAGRGSAEAEALVKDAREAVSLLAAAGAAHNPLAAGALLDVARERAAKARGLAGAATGGRGAAK